MSRAAAAALLAVAACAPALRTPSPLEPAPGTGADLASAPELRALADASYARRPDAAAVRKADELYVAAAAADPHDVEALLGAIRAKTWLAEHEPDAGARTALATAAVDAGQWCEQRAPANPTCDYGLALALGLQARERHATAVEGLKLMVEHLRRAAAGDPRQDSAGPHRVLALVLLRAPAWPVGPGDTEAALEEARKAVALFPDYPPNQLALAETLSGNGHPDAGRAAAERALALARARQAAGDQDAADWIRAAEKLLGTS